MLILAPTGEQNKAPQRTNHRILHRPIKIEPILQYHNWDPLLHLIVPANEADVVVDNVETVVLIDTGAQVCTISQTLLNTWDGKLNIWMQ